MRVAFVYGACVRDGAWWWHRTAKQLQQEGISSVTPLLPNCGEGGAAGAGLPDDVAAVRSVLQDGDEPTVVVAHSYGGLVTADIASVSHLLLVASYLPQVGQSLSDFGGDDGPAPYLDLDPDAGTFTVRADLAVQTFMQDCEPEIQQQALQRLARQSLSVLGSPVAAAAWQQLPTTYFVCAQYQGTSAAAQRGFASRAGRVVEMETGHHPFLSRPAEVRDLLLEL